MASLIPPRREITRTSRSGRPCRNPSVACRVRPPAHADGHAQADRLGNVDAGRGRYDANRIRLGVRARSENGSLQREALFERVLQGDQGLYVRLHANLHLAKPLRLRQQAGDSDPVQAESLPDFALRPALDEIHPGRPDAKHARGVHAGVDPALRRRTGRFWITVLHGSLAPSAHLPGHPRRLPDGAATGQCRSPPPSGGNDPLLRRG